MNLLAKLLIVFSVAVGSKTSPASEKKFNPFYEDMIGSNMSTPELIALMGYPVEVHSVTTEDGYILDMHRIPHGKEGPGEGEKPVAYLQHCLLGSSADWIMNSPDKALAYMLADKGYDVWMGNFRGNTYSKKHASLTPEEKGFWKFSWDEMAYYDLPSQIDYVLKNTKQDQVYYVGFSMGTTTMFALLSEQPEYNDKIRVAAMLAPAVFMEHAKGPLKLLAPYSNQIDLAMSLLGVNEFLPSTELMDHLMNLYCDELALTAEMCYNIMFLICGPSEGEINKHFLPVILSHFPAGSSFHTVNHYLQLVLSKNFQKYDFGSLGNLGHYGHKTPPEFDLSRVSVPVGIYWSDSDWLADPEDVRHLSTQLPRLVYNHRVNKTLFNHADFAWALHADQLVYKYVFDLFSNY